MLNECSIMPPRPNHIDKYVEKLPDKNKYVEYTFTDYSIPYEVKCSCGCREFRVYHNEEPRVEVECTACGNRIIVYDLDLYVCSQKYTEEALNVYVSPEGDKSFNVCVIYEYSDEFAISDGEFNYDLLEANVAGGMVR